MQARTVSAAAVCAALLLAPSASAAIDRAPEPAARWVTTATTGGPFAQSPQLSAFKDGSAFAVVDGVKLQPTDDGSTGLGIIRSKDGGQTWDAPVTQPAFTGEPLLAMADGSRGFFAGGDRISRTQDGATSWTQLTVPRVVRNGGEYTTAVAAGNGGRSALLAKDGFEFADGCPFLLRRTPIQITNDAGRSWTDRSIPITSYPTYAELAGPARALVTTYPYDYEEPVRDGDSCSVGGGTLTTVRHMVTANSGRTWRTAHECRVPCAATWSDASTLVIVQRDGTVLVGGNGGTGLKQSGRLPGVSADAGQFVHSVDFLDRKLGYAAVFGAGTFRTVDGGKTWVLDRPEVGTGGVVGVFNDVAAIDGLRAVAASTAGIHARIADPLPGKHLPLRLVGPTRAMLSNAALLQLDGTRTLTPRRR